MESEAGEEVVLVDEQGQPIGVEEKLAAHRDGGQLHLAFSVYVFNARGELLLQRRAAGKYHFAGLWSNTCCGHPRPGEGVVQGAERRLEEEFGFRTELRPVLTYSYQARDPESGLSEHELLNVLAGEFEGEPRPDADEIEEWRWRDLDAVRRQVREAPEQVTPWFRLTLERWPGSA